MFCISPKSIPHWPTRQCPCNMLLFGLEILLYFQQGRGWIFYLAVCRTLFIRQISSVESLQMIQISSEVCTSRASDIQQTSLSGVNGDVINLFFNSFTSWNTWHLMADPMWKYSCPIISCCRMQNSLNLPRFLLKMPKPCSFHVPSLLMVLQWSPLVCH